MACWGGGILTGGCMTRPHKLIADPKAASLSSKSVMEPRALQEDLETLNLIMVQPGPSELTPIRGIERDLVRGCAEETLEMSHCLREHTAAGHPTFEASAVRGKRGITRGLNPREEFQAQQCSVTASAAVSTAMSELESLREECQKERRQSERNANRLHALQARRDKELEELSHLSSGLEEKEQDVLSIQFDMVEVQNRLHDQTKLACDQTETIQKLTQELADKDNKLELAKVLLSQVSEISDQLQRKVMVLNQELEGSRAAQEALGKELRVLVAEHESERQSTMTELVRVRVEATAQSADLRAQVRQQEAAAAERCDALEQELQAMQGQAERSALELKAQLKSKKLALARTSAEAGFREAALLAELWAEAAKHGYFLRKLRESAKVARVSSSHSQPQAVASAGWQEVQVDAVGMLIAEVARETASHAQELQEQLASKLEQLTSTRDQLLDLAMALESNHPLESKALLESNACGGGGAACDQEVRLGGTPGVFRSGGGLVRLCPPASRAGGA